MTSAMPPLARESWKLLASIPLRGVYVRNLCQVLSLCLLQMVAALAFPLLIKWGFESLVRESQTGPIAVGLDAGRASAQGSTWTSGAWFGAAVLAYIAHCWIWNYAKAVLAIHIGKGIGSLQIRLLSNALTRPRRTYSQWPASKLNEVICNQCWKLEKSLTSFLPQVLCSILLLAAIVVYLHYRVLAIGLGLVVLLSVVLLLTTKFRRRLSLSTTKLSRARAVFAERVARIGRNLDSIHAEAAKQSEQRRASAHVEALESRGESLVRTQLHHALVTQLPHIISLGLIFIGGTSAIRAGVLAVPELIAFVILAEMIRNHLTILFQAYPNVLEALGSFNSVREFLLPSPPLYTGTVKFPFSSPSNNSSSGYLFAKQVSFGFASRPILRSINFTLVPGEITALQGVNGSGKTTLLLMLLGLYRPDEGSFLAEGHSYDELDLDSLRHHIAYVPQIIAGQGDLRGGSRSLALSGGQTQKQRLTAALAKHPLWLFLDEPTTSLDSDATLWLRKALQNFAAQGGGVLATSHDPNLCEVAHTRLILHDGALSCERAHTRTSVRGRHTERKDNRFAGNDGVMHLFD